MVLTFGAVFGVIGGRLVQLAVSPAEQVGLRKATAQAVGIVRPDIIDRNGEILATDVRTVSVFAETGKILDKDERWSCSPPSCRTSTPQSCAQSSVASR